MFVHETIGDEYFDDVKNKKTAPNGHHPNPPIDFVVKRQQMIRGKEKQTSNEQDNEVNKQSLFLFDSVSCIFV